jgi:Glycosyl transferase family 11
MKNKARYNGNRTHTYTVLPHVTILRKYAIDWKTLIIYWTELQKKLRFHPHLLRKSQETLTEIAKATNCVEFVAVHVRRTDYLQYIHRWCV